MAHKGAVCLCEGEDLLKKWEVQLCNGRILKTCVITISLRELLQYCQHNIIVGMTFLLLLPSLP